MLIDGVGLLAQARTAGRAIAGVNVYSLEGVRAVVAAAEAMRAPVMVQLHPAAVRLGGPPLIVAAIEAARRSTTDVGVHLDHAEDLGAIVTGLELGVTSVMADGSALSYARNVDFTIAAVAAARRFGAGVEAELGRIAGVEDGDIVDGADGRLTDPDEAQAFVAATGIDALAVCVGNVHGATPTPPTLHLDRLAALAEVVAVPLVLHGASDLDGPTFATLISLGVTKFNVNTAVRRAGTEAMRTALDQPAADLVDVLTAAETAMTASVATHLRLFAP